MSTKVLRACTVAQSVGFFSGMVPQMREAGYEVVALSSPGPELEALAGQGVRVHAVPMQRRIAPWADVRSLWRIYRVLRRERPAMVHSMTPKAGMLCMLAGWLARVPRRVHTFTGLVFPTARGWRRRLLMATDALTCAAATHIIPEGEGVMADLRRVTRKPMRVLGYGNCRGVDLVRFSPEDEQVQRRAAQLRQPGVLTFVFVGRLVGDKGINELVEAFVRLNAEMPATRLVLVGGTEEALDPLRADTMRTIQSHAAISAPGQQRDVRPWLAAADVLVFPSYREGFPNVVLEAGAMGLPSIVTDINGSREIVTEGVNGVVIPPRDAEALYGAMRRLAEDAPLRRRLGEAARPRIAERYEQGYVRRCLMEYYNEILQ